jgi:hypothetical protein
MRSLFDPASAPGVTRSADATAVEQTLSRAATAPRADHVFASAPEHVAVDATTPSPTAHLAAHALSAAPAPAHATVQRSVHAPVHPVTTHAARSARDRWVRPASTRSKGVRVAGL